MPEYLIQDPREYFLFKRVSVILSCSDNYNYTDSCCKIGYGFLDTRRSKGFFPLYGKSRGSEDAKCPVLE